MAYLFDGATSKLVLSSALFTAVPFTMACFFKTSLVAQLVLLAADDGSALHRFLLSTGATGTVLGTTTETTSASAVTTDVFSANMWNSGAMVSQSGTSRYAVLNGRLSAVQATNKSPTGISEFVIGNSGPGTLSWSGLLAEIAVWQAALTPRELQSFNDGKPANQIRLESLILYMPLTAQQGTVGIGPRANILANTACIPVSDHPRILRPVKRALRRPSLVLTH